MRRSRNDMDDLMQLALYMFPKYMKRIQKYDRRHFEDLHHGEDHHYEHDEYADLKDLIGFIEKNIIRDKGKEGMGDKKIGKKIDGGKPQNTGKNPIHEEILKKAQEQIKKSGQGPDKKLSDDRNVRQDGRAAKSIKQLDSKETREMPTKDVCFSACNEEIKNLLNRYVNKKFDICTDGDENCVFEQINLICADEELAKFKNGEGEIIVIPVRNIVGMNLPEPVYMEEHSKKDDMTYYPLEKSLCHYFGAIIGKRVCIQTRGQGKFKYLSRKLITGTGKGFVIIENNIVILFSKIIFIRESKLDEYKNS
ncbi:hypothetical protein ACFHWD_07175 [Clostridium sp. MT-14]|uniref:hypothetical protein n=1 Tax=Clostridium sp. MT-14 TaxID=3348360 RepID=UPI0035F328D4